MRAQALDGISFKLASLSAGTTGGIGSLMTADWAIALFGVPVSVILAAFAGAMISLSFLPAPSDLKRAAVGVGCNTLIGTYGAPGVAKMLGWSEPHLALGLAFGIALTIQFVAPIAYKAIPDLLKAWTDRIRGGGGRS